MADVMNLEVVSRDKVLVKNSKVTSVVVPGISGDLGILPHHAALLTVLKEGKLHYKTDNENFDIQIKSGFIEVLNNKVIVLISELAEEDN